MFIHIILDVHSDLNSIQESRMCSKTPSRMLQRLKGECHLPVYMKTWNFVQSFLNIYNIIPDVQSHLDSIQESGMSFKIPWRMLWRLKGECPLPVHLEVWNFAKSFLNIYICHSWHQNSSRLYSGVTNVLKNSLREALDPHRRMSSSSRPTGSTFCTELH